MEERCPVPPCRNAARVLLASMATISLAIGMVACSQTRNSQPAIPALSPDASLDLVPLAGDAGNALPGTDSLADAASDSSPTEVEAGSMPSGWDGSVDTGSDAKGTDASDGGGISRPPITACTDIQARDTDEILAEASNRTCMGDVYCELGPSLSVCSRSFGASVYCSCRNNLMSCRDERPNAIGQESFDLSIDGGVGCPMPSWPHDAGSDLRLPAGN